MINWFKGIIDGTDKIIDNFKLEPKEKLKAKVHIRELALKESDSVRQFALDYEGRAKDVPKWILILRSTIRPLITIIMTLSLMSFLFYDIFNLLKNGNADFVMSKLPNAYYVILGIVLGFWFGGKAGENMIDKLKGKA